MNGSPTCTAGRFSADFSSNSATPSSRRGCRRGRSWRRRRRPGCRRPTRRPGRCASCLRNAEAEDVDQRVARVGLVERDLAADGRDADAVAVAGDAGDDALDDATVARAVGPIERSEPQRVQQRDRPRAHREDVADDAADARRRALVRLDERRVVVGLDLEDRREAVADVDGARVLARSLQDARPGRRERLEVNARALVAAVLRPHHREDAELGQGRLAPQRVERCARTRRA